MTDTSGNERHNEQLTKNKYRTRNSRVNIEIHVEI